MLCWLRQRRCGGTQGELEELKKQSTVIRVIAHTQIKKVSNWGQKKAHLLEVQVCACPLFTPSQPSHHALYLVSQRQGDADV